MSAPAVGGDLFRWELAIPDLAPDKTGKTGGDVPEILFESSNCKRLWGGVDNAGCIFSAKTGGEQGLPWRWKSDWQPLYRAPVVVRRAPCRRSRLRSVESLPRYVFQNVGKGRHCCKQRVRRSKKPEFPMLCVLRDKPLRGFLRMRFSLTLSRK